MHHRLDLGPNMLLGAQQHTTVESAAALKIQDKIEGKYNENMQSNNGQYSARFFCLFLWLCWCINVLRNIGECCESVPLNRTGSYVSISINITRILACVVQVDAFYYQSLSWLHLHCNGSWLLVFK